MQPSAIIGLVNVIACSLLVLASFPVRFLIKNAAKKRRAYLILVLATDVTFLGVSIGLVMTGTPPFILIPVISFLSLLTILGFRRFRFCPTCAEQVVSIWSFRKPPERCRSCGAPLNSPDPSSSPPPETQATPPPLPNTK